MHEREIADSILGTLRADDRPLRDRLYTVLVGPILCVGPPWPEDPEAYRLCGEVDQLMRQALRRLARLNPERVDSAGNMLIHMSDDSANGLAAAIEQFSERYAMAARAA